MRTAKLKIKRTVKARLVATPDQVKIKFPKQTIGVVPVYFRAKDGREILIKQFELVLQCDSLKVVTLK